MSTEDLFRTPPAALALTVAERFEREHVTAWSRRRLPGVAHTLPRNALVFRDLAVLRAKVARSGNHFFALSGPSVLPGLHGGRFFITTWGPELFEVHWVSQSPGARLREIETFIPSFRSADDARRFVFHAVNVLPTPEDTPSTNLRVPGTS